MKQQITIPVLMHPYRPETTNHTLTADVEAGYGIHRTIEAGMKQMGHYWTITHIKSGAALGVWYESSKQAREYREVLKKIEINGVPFADLERCDAVELCPLAAVQMAALLGEDVERAARKAERAAAHVAKILCPQPE